MLPSSTRLLFCLTSFLAPAAPLAASDLLGTVQDPAGQPVSAAEVALTHPATGLRLRALTRDDGGYEFLGLPSGAYLLQAAKEGFAPLRREGLVLPAGDRVTLALELRLGDQREAVEVNAAAPLLQANRGTVSFAMEQKRVVTLPLDGRNFVPLIALAPGVSLPPGSLLPRINGSRPRVSEYLYDGLSVLQPEPGQVAFFPIIDAIDEFRVELNSYPAEYGRANGGVILVSQKSGTNQLRGTLFEFFRHEQLNARNLFASAGGKPRFRRNQFGFVLGGPVQTNRTFFFADWQGTRLNTGVVRISNVPAASEAAGVFSEAVFDPATTRLVAGLYQRDAFPRNAIPLSRQDPAARAMLPRYPQPNVFTATGAPAQANNFRRLGNDDTVAHQFDGRLDRYFGQRHRLFARYTFLRDDSRPTTPLPDGSGNLTTGVIGDSRTRADQLGGEHTFTLTPGAVNQLRLGHTRRAFTRQSLRLAEPVSAATLIPNLPVTSFADVLPTYDIVGLQQLGPPSNGNARFATSVTQLFESISWIRRSHHLKAGADIRRQTLDILQPPSPTGNFQFTNLFTAALSPTGTARPGTGNSFASFLTGQVGRFRLDSQPSPIEPRATVAEFFVQDDWRLAPQFTLNLGVRYTLNFPSTVVGNRGAVFHLARQQLDFLGANGTPRGARRLEKANFAPRLGLAWRPSANWAVRAGYGLTWIEQAGITTPFTTPLFPFIQTLGEQSLDNLQPAFILSQGPSVRLQPASADSGLGQGVFAVQRDNGSGYAQQWNLLLQKVLRQNWSLEAGYLGSKLTRLGVPDVNLNQLTVEQLALGAQLTEPVANPLRGQVPANSPLGAPFLPRGQLLRPYPRFTTVSLYRNNIGHSTYHSFQGRVEKRWSQGLSLTLSYTFSRLLDDAGAVFDSAVLTGPVTNFQVADSFNRRLEKDASTGHIPHIASLGFVYDLPFGAENSRGGWRKRLATGWQLAGLGRLQSGSPVAVTQQTNLNAFAGFGIQRPNRLADPALPAARRTVERWFNPAAFTPAPQFTLGNSSRNPVTGPGYRAFDLMLAKSIAHTERLRTELRIEAFNVTNTPPLGPPNGSFGNLAFGTITTALDPRVLEVVWKLHF